MEPLATQSSVQGAAQRARISRLGGLSCSACWCHPALCCSVPAETTSRLTAPMLTAPWIAVICAFMLERSPLALLGRLQCGSGVTLCSQGSSSSPSFFTHHVQTFLTWVADLCLASPQTCCVPFLLTGLLRVPTRTVFSFLLPPKSCRCGSRLMVPRRPSSIWFLWTPPPGTPAPTLCYMSLLPYLQK